MSERAKSLFGVSCLLALTISCNNSGPGSASGGAGNGGTGGGGTTPEISFGGPIDAAPIDATSISVQWVDATNTEGDPPAGMAYDLYRGTSLAMENEVLVVADLLGITSHIDTDLLDDISYFYRVVARDQGGLEAADTQLVSSHLPKIPATPLDYETDIAPLWSAIEANDGVSFCTDCHVDTGTVYGTLSLQSWERLMIGVGTPEKPDTVIVVGNSKATGANAVESFFFYDDVLPAHNMWFYKRGLFIEPVRRWVDEGATEIPDVLIPQFDFNDLQNQSRYSAISNRDDTATVTFPHASDPESEPFRGTVNDHLEYRVYGGIDSLHIDWRTPVAIVDRYHFEKSEEFYSVQFAWVGETGAFVVRARDYARNETLNELEVSF